MDDMLKWESDFRISMDEGKTWKEVKCIKGWSFSVSFNTIEGLIEYKEITPLTPQKCLAVDFIIRGSVDN